MPYAFFALISLFFGLRYFEPHFLHFSTPLLFLDLHLLHTQVFTISASASGNFPINITD